MGRGTSKTHGLTNGCAAAQIQVERFARHATGLNVPVSIVLLNVVNQTVAANI